MQKVCIGIYTFVLVSSAIFKRCAGSIHNSNFYLHFDLLMSNIIYIEICIISGILSGSVKTLKLTINQKGSEYLQFRFGFFQDTIELCQICTHNKCCFDI